MAIWNKSKQLCCKISDKTLCKFKQEGIVLVVHVTNECDKVMKNLDGMNIITQLKVQNHRNTFEATSTTVLHGLSYQNCPKKMLRPGRT